MEVLRITDWNKIFENNRTRQLTRLEWVPLPNKHDGDGYNELICHPDGPAHYAAWVVIVQVASKCVPRGTLLRDGHLRESRTHLTESGTPLQESGTPLQGISGDSEKNPKVGKVGKVPKVRPHDAKSLSRKTRIPDSIFEEVIPRLLDLGWLEVVDITEDMEYVAPPCGNPAPPCDIPASPCPGMEGNGREGKGKEKTLDQDKNPDLVFENWNTLASENKKLLQLASVLTPARRKKIQTRLKERGWLAGFHAALLKLPLPRPPGEWQPTIDFLIKNSDNAIKVAEGAYDWSPGGNGSKGDPRDNFSVLENALQNLEPEETEVIDVQAAD